MLQLAPALLSAQSEAIRRLFPARPTDYLTDVAGVVDGGTAAAINDLAARLRRATGAEVGCGRTSGHRAIHWVMSPSIVGRAWGVGAKGSLGDSTRNAGVVLLLVPRTSEHKGEIYISTGRGIEGIITDATAGRISDLMLPDLRQGNWGAALLLGTRAIASVTAKGFGVTDSALAAADPFRGRSGGSQEINPAAVILVVIVVIIILSNISGGGGGRGRRRGPTIFFPGGFGGEAGAEVAGVVVAGVVVGSAAGAVALADSVAAAGSAVVAEEGASR